MNNKKHLIFIVSIICIFLFGFIYKNQTDSQQLLINNDATNSTGLLTTTDNANLDENAGTISYETKIAGDTEPDIIGSENTPVDEPNIFVYITGEVTQPNVYELNPGSRVADLIDAAGGFTGSADAENVNLAQKLFDEQHIHVFKIGEMPGPENAENNIAPFSNTINTTAPSDGKIDINTADGQLLSTLPSIGPTIAQNIIDFREAQGRFENIEDIKKVDRIGDKTFDKIKDLIVVR
ncbi:MAG: ComEA family DNA-binding protein [Clostridiales bacterium]|jgi:competence protein ComEA|nr:ComEA family DNA-binding protein [Clostridiales bacterium]